MNSNLSTQDFKVPPGDGETNLLSFLAGHLKTSKKKAKKLLDDRCVLVNGRRIWMAHHILQPGQSVTIVSTASSRPQGKALNVLYEDSDYLIVNKPAGRLTNEEESVESDLRKQLNEPSLLAAHRLDKDTTGCLLVARSNQAFDAAVKLFREKRISKSYHAIVSGRMQPDPKTIAKPLEDLPALTHYRTLDTGPEASHLLVRIDTGRTHQIRKHLAGLGYPIVGDRFYATRRNSSSRAMKVGRQMLQASGTAGLYEVLEYESTLDLKDRQGERATFKKRSRKSPKP